MLTPELEQRLRAHLADRAVTHPPALGLHTAIAQGDLGLVPPDLQWSNSAGVAHLINGYDLCLEAGFGDLIEFCNAKRAAAQFSSWSGNLVELWLCLFGEHRRERHGGGYPLEEQDRRLLDGLCKAFATACAKVASTPGAPRHRTWSDECADLLEYFVWEPQHLGQNKYLPADQRRPPQDVAARVMRQEVPLNHQLNLFFRLAPVSLAERWFESLFPSLPVTGPSLLRANDLYAPVCQPDMFFQAASTRLFVELKVGSRTSLDQLYRYAALAAALDHRRGAQPWGMVFLGPKEQWFSNIASFVQDHSDYRPSPRILSQLAAMGLTPAAVETSLRSKAVAVTTFTQLSEFLAREQGRLEANREGDETLWNLLGGLRRFLPT